MARDAKIVDVFLSSPNDVNEERLLVVSAAREWNSLHSRKRSVHLNILTWEDAVAPAVENRSQEAINKQIGNDYDVYLGVMWSRFGSATGASDSGTVEEYELALSRYRGGENLRLAMLFKTSDIPTSVLDGSQYSKVQGFKKIYSDNGGFYREFDTPDQLRFILYRLFDQISDGFSPDSAAHDCTQAHLSPRLVDSAATPVSTTEVSEEETDEELGLFEAHQLLTEASAQQASFLEGWSTLMSENTQLTGRISEEFESLARVGNIDPARINARMKESADSLDRISNYIDNGLPRYIEINDEIARLIQASISISRDFDDDTASTKWRNDTLELINNIRSNCAQTDSLNEALRGIPRLSGVFNKARNRMLRSNTRIVAENRRLERILMDAAGLNAPD